MRIALRTKGQTKASSWATSPLPISHIIVFIVRNHRRPLVLHVKKFARYQSLALVAGSAVREGRVEKTNPRSAGYPLTPTPPTTLRTTPRTTLRLPPQTTLNKQPNLRLRGKETKEDYMLHLNDHNCIKIK